MITVFRQLMLMTMVMAIYAFIIALMMFLLVAATRAEPATLTALQPAFTLTPQPGAAVDKTYRITRDTGGIIGLYLDHYRMLKYNHTKIIVDGLCNSACTLALANPDLCVTERAWFGFHSASTQAGTDLLMATYPKQVKEWIAARGGLTTKVLFAQGHELAAKCKP